MPEDLHVQKKVRDYSYGKKKKKNAKKLVLGVLIAYVAIMALGYMGVSYYFSSHFLKGTTISGIDCSNKTATQVKKKIQKQLGAV